MSSPNRHRDATSAAAEVKPLIGTVLTLPGATVAELMSEPFDVVWVDLEHAALGVGLAADVILGAQATGSTVLVRLPVGAEDLIAICLDAGADGIVLADVRDADMATRAVSRVRVAPDGERGWGPRRLSTRHRRVDGPRPPPEIWAQIESAAGVAAAQEIASVDGIDMLVPGVADLSFGLGIGLQFGSPQLIEAVRQVRAAAFAAGKRYGLAGSLDSLDESLFVGASALIHSTEARIAAAAVDAAADLIRGRAADAGRTDTKETHG